MGRLLLQSSPPRSSGHLVIWGKLQQQSGQTTFRIFNVAHMMTTERTRVMIQPNLLRSCRQCECLSRLFRTSD